MVREKQKIVASCASIVIDLTPDHHVGVSSRSSYECAIRIAATLCKHLHESGSSVRLVCVGLSSLSSLVVDNSRGISTVFDFLAELPTLELARARMLSESNGAVDQNETFANRWASLGTRKFLIATDRTDSFGISNRAAFQSITIQLKEFASDLENYEEVRMSAETLPDVPWGNESGLGSNIAIVDPELAASQFVSGWKENYGHVA